MWAVVGENTEGNETDPILVSPGFSVLKTWIVKNKSNLAWSDKVQMSTKTFEKSWALPKITHPLKPGEKGKLKVKISIPYKIEEGQVDK